MKDNRSPWIHQLQHDRVRKTLQSDHHAGVAIIGAGIAGISTAFFLLKYTDKKVVILEADKMAHGATGHNAGQVVSYFERGFASLVKEYGLTKAAEGQKAIEDAWVLLDEMYTDAGLDIPFSRFLGHAGLANVDQIILHLHNNALRREAGLPTERVWIADSAQEILHNIPQEYATLYEVVPVQAVQEVLETERPEFVAALSYPKGCINSALFCQEVMSYLLTSYPDRVSLFEHTPIAKVVLKDGGALLDAGYHEITVQKVVLCTNGFESITILHEKGLAIDAMFHYVVDGVVGYMSGYLEPLHKAPTAISYLNGTNTADPYFYVTRRPFEYEPGVHHNLISVGGPDDSLSDTRGYERGATFPEHAEAAIATFVQETYGAEKPIDYLFTWHGLMGYTKNRIRLIGPDPRAAQLLYNLGCNGIGILPSVYGGKRIAAIVAGQEVEPSIFDVVVQ